MRIGDLVKVSKKDWSAIGVITEVLSGTNCRFVRYFAPQRGNITGGLWSHQHITVLTEVDYEKDTGKT